MQAARSERPYAIYDVFTSQPLAGNPLAVVFDADGLDTERMQAIAREFNLSETVFVLRPANSAHSARLRIFTPVQELPFAGHPTVGGAIALAHQRNGGEGAGGHDCDCVLMLEEAIGNVRCLVRLTQGEHGAGFAEFDLPRSSKSIPFSADRGLVADALGINKHRVGFENHAISLWSAGVAYLLVPVNDLASVGECVCDAAAWEALAPLHDGHLASAYVYCRGGLDHAVHFHARMFAPHMGTPEDPATGSAVAALSGAIVRFDGLFNGHHSMIVEQGMEMGRPSRINLAIDVKAGEVVRTRIGGEAVCVAQGRLHA